MKDGNVDDKHIKFGGWLGGNFGVLSGYLTG
jgi:hypothetical protein